MGSFILKSAATDAGMKLFLQRLDIFLLSRGVSQETRNRILALVTHAQEYVQFCQKMGRDPADKMALATFLFQKQIFTAHMTQNESAECYAAIAGFVIDAYTRAEFLAGGPVGIALYVSFLALDTLEIGNSCEFLQRAYYEEFLKPMPGGPSRESMKKKILQSHNRPNTAFGVTIAGSR